MNEYRTIDISPDKNASGTVYQSEKIVTDHGENIERMLLDIINIQRQQEKQLRSLNTCGAIIALAAAVQLIIWGLTVLGYMNLISR